MAERAKSMGDSRPVPRGASDGSLDITDIHSEVSQAVLQETRLRILAVLASAEADKRGGFSLQEMGQILGCSAQNAHHHLKILERVGAAYVARTEATQRIPRQFWATDIRHIRLRPAPGTVLEVDLGQPEGDMRRLSRQVREWAEHNGTAEHADVALKVVAFLSSLDSSAADHLLRILKENHDNL